MIIAGYVLALAIVVIVVAEVVSVPVPQGVFAIAIVAGAILAMARRERYVGVATSQPISQAAIDSDGWRRETFVMTGLEEDGEALQDYTDEARMYGYRREPAGEKYSWRFTRAPRS